MREDIRKWVEALESGEYSQCLYQLTDGTGYCCLGVYSVVNDLEIPWPNYGPNDYEFEGNGPLYDELLERLPYDLFRKGPVWNDTEGYSFQKIAQLIRELHDAS